MLAKQQLEKECNGPNGPDGHSGKTWDKRNWLVCGARKLFLSLYPHLRFGGLALSISGYLALARNNRMTLVREK
jgi:hypothetical protein